MITFIVMNRNLYTWPKAMIKSLEHHSLISKILIVDNDSSYTPLLEWYKTLKHEVIRLNDNYGHFSAWKEEVLEKVETPYYIVSDPDLSLENLPNNYIERMFIELIVNPNYRKVGLSLSIPTSSWYKNNFKDSYERERFYQSIPLEDGVFKVPIDTTFAIYSFMEKQHFVGGVRLPIEYSCRHLPWEKAEIEKIEEEYKYYLKYANESSSIKSRLSEII